MESSRVENYKKMLSVNEYLKVPLSKGPGSSVVVRLLKGQQLRIVGKMALSKHSLSDWRRLNTKVENMFNQQCEDTSVLNKSEIDRQMKKSAIVLVSLKKIKKICFRALNMIFAVYSGKLHFLDDIYSSSYSWI